jgi:signal transduction histidine kinase
LRFHPRVEIGSTRAPMTTRDARPIVCRVRLGRGFFYSGNDERTPPEVWILRTIGGAFVVLFVVKTLTTDPKPALHGDGLGVLLGLIGFTVGVVLTNPRSKAREPRRTGGLLLVIASSAVLAGFQPDGVWQACPYFVAIVGAVRFDWKRGVAIYGLSLVALTIVAAANGRADDALNVAIGSIPWFLVLRLMRRMREYGEALELSQEAEAAAAADAERGRVAREMHDVLAHSLSALALQLESARLVARDRGADPEVVDSIDRAHHQAVEGLEEARRAIGALRGDALPGPERLPALVEAFEEQSGVHARLETVGRPRSLPTDASLALYRTAQEALTNIRRHAVPDSVTVRLEYRDDATVLAVEDVASQGPAIPVGAPAGAGYGLTGMRERAELLDGRLTAEPTARGFRVELWLPR